MRRREVITLLQGAAAALPPARHPQQPPKPLIRVLRTQASGDDPQLLTAFRSGLKEAGYVEGQNVAMEYRFADNQYDRLPTLAAELVRRRVAVIVANGRAAQTAKETTPTIPNRLRGRVRPGRCRTSRQHEPTRGQRHWREQTARCATAAPAAP